MFESTWYKCGKLNADLVNRATNAYDMEVEALQHILGWLGAARCVHLLVCNRSMCIHRMCIMRRVQ